MHSKQINTCLQIKNLTSLYNTHSIGGAPRVKTHKKHLEGHINLHLLQQNVLTTQATNMWGIFVEHVVKSVNEKFGK